MSENEMLPDCWRWCRIDELIAAPVVYGILQPGPNLEVGIPYIRPTEIDNDSIQVSELRRTSTAIAGKYERSKIAADDVILSIVGTIGKVAIVPQEIAGGNITQSSARLRFNQAAISNRFAAWALRSPILRRQFDKMRLGTAVPRLNIAHVRDLRIPVAPLNEQRRIVAKIEELFSDLDAGVAALERVKANLKRYRAAVLKSSVEGKLTEAWRDEHTGTEPASKLLERILTERRQKWETDQLAKFAAAKKEPPKNWKAKYVEPSPPDTIGMPELPELPDGWCWTTANHLCAQITDGEHIQPPYQEEGFPMLTATHVRNSHVEFKDVGYISESDFRRCLQRCAPAQGDVLIVSVGATTGRAGIVQECQAFALVRSVLLLKPIRTGSFLLDWIQSPWCQNWIGRASGATAQAHFYISDAKRMPVPLPPQHEQAEIVDEVDRLLSVIAAAESQIEHGLQRAARLRQSILKQAFEGKLVPQDPTDEPAAKLAERVSVERSEYQHTENSCVRVTRRLKATKAKGPQ